MNGRLVWRGRVVGARSLAAVLRFGLTHPDAAGYMMLPLLS